MRLNEATLLDEPAIEFSEGQFVADPHDGLALFGPYDRNAPSQPKQICYGLIGAQEGVRAFETFSGSLNRAHDAGADGHGRAYSARQWPPFPGFESAFHCIWPGRAAWVQQLDRSELIRKANHVEGAQRTFDVVNMFLEAVRVASERDDPFGIIVCVVPDEVWRNCRIKSVIRSGIGDKLSRSLRSERQRGQTALFDDTRGFKYSIDFRRQLKARTMKYDIPIQLIRESTLGYHDPEFKSKLRGLTPPSDLRWNLSTTVYYKAGGKPWKLATARDGVCYIGLAFRKANDRPRDGTAVCAAQMFLDTGDGVVFRGRSGKWYSEKDRQFHLSRTAAHELLSGVLQVYRDQGGKELREIFLHSRSDISADEFSGYKDACPAGVSLVGVRVHDRSGGIRAFREGAYPVFRGTVWKLGPKTSLLWASGFKPRLATYDGADVPVPLRIDIQHGDADIEQVTRDIYGLTKLNYNSCKLGYSEPVTVHFSDAVGEILVANKDIENPRPQFKFYI